MKVDFKDCEFGCFEPHRDIYHNGKKYKAIDVHLIRNDGAVEYHTIAEHELEKDLFKKAVDGNLRDEDEIVDNSISYYAENNDGVYFILENIVGEEIR